jgi:hypothetical protein
MAESLAYPQVATLLGGNLAAVIIVAVNGANEETVSIFRYFGRLKPSVQ